jgi:hypothetical protein
MCDGHRCGGVGHADHGDPRADVKQTVGRVLRSAPGKKQPVVLDLVDSNSIFQGFHQSRLKQYYSLGADIVSVRG